MSQTGINIALYQHLHQLKARKHLDLCFPCRPHFVNIPQLFQCLLFKIRKHTTLQRYIYSELAQQLQTVTGALQTTNSTSTTQGEQLKYFKQFSDTHNGFFSVDSYSEPLPWTEGQGKCELEPLIPLSCWFLCNASQSSIRGPWSSFNCAFCIGSTRSQNIKALM